MQCKVQIINHSTRVSVNAQTLRERETKGDNPGLSVQFLMGLGQGRQPWPFCSVTDVFWPRETTLAILFSPLCVLTKGDHPGHPVQSLVCLGQGSQPWPFCSVPDVSQPRQTTLASRTQTDIFTTRPQRWTLGRREW